MFLLFCLDTKKYRSGPTWNGTAKKNQDYPPGATRPGLPAQGWILNPMRTIWNFILILLHATNTSKEVRSYFHFFGHHQGEKISKQATLWRKLMIYRMKFLIRFKIRPIVIGCVKIFANWLKIFFYKYRETWPAVTCRLCVTSAVRRRARKQVW